MPALLIDLDGVIYQGNQMVPGASETINWIVDKQIPHLYLTNTTSRPRHAMFEKLASIGAKVNEQDILTPPIATRQWLREHVAGAIHLVVPEATTVDFEGVELSGDDDCDAVSAVIIGDIGEEWTFGRLNHVFRLLMHEPKPALVALGMTRYWRAEDGLRLDVGAYITALEYAVGCKAIVMGKPSIDFFNSGLSMLGSAAQDTIMIGDDIVGDVHGAQHAGIRGVLVRTGKFRTQDLQHSQQPDAVIDSIADLPNWLHGY